MVAAAHERVTNARGDFQRKLSRRLDGIFGDSAKPSTTRGIYLLVGRMKRSNATRGMFAKNGTPQPQLKN
jgi:hypothetical protein